MAQSWPLFVPYAADRDGVSAIGVPLGHHGQFTNEVIKVTLNWIEDLALPTNYGEQTRHTRDPAQSLFTKNLYVTDSHLKLNC